MTTLPPSDENLAYHQMRERAIQNMVTASFIVKIGGSLAAILGFFAATLIDTGWQDALRVFALIVTICIAPGILWLLYLSVQYVRDLRMFRASIYIPPIVITAILGLLWWLSSAKA